mmetsp:Transcript_13100/g.34766  ORF Transcript_13100/g.34766 Transcript_13100/m.34766 type:complete len:312 (-) Transcript_13100:2072-3007(-)
MPASVRGASVSGRSQLRHFIAGTCCLATSVGSRSSSLSPARRAAMSSISSRSTLLFNCRSVLPRSALLCCIDASCDPSSVRASLSSGTFWPMSDELAESSASRPSTEARASTRRFSRAFTSSRDAPAGPLNFSTRSNVSVPVSKDSIEGRSSMVWVSSSTGIGLAARSTRLAASSAARRSASRRSASRRSASSRSASRRSASSRSRSNRSASRRAFSASAANLSASAPSAASRAASNLSISACMRSASRRWRSASAAALAWASAAFAFWVASNQQFQTPQTLTLAMRLKIFFISSRCLSSVSSAVGGRTGS